MRVRWIQGLVVARIFFGITAAAQEPLVPTLTPTIITATKQVTLFTGLEKQILEAVQKKDRAGLEAMLTDDLEIAMPHADAVAGEEWLDSVLAKDFTLRTFVISQMSVADLGDFAVVKYERGQQATLKGKAYDGEFFVVDLWKKSGDSWKLANRYVARIHTAPTPARAKPRPTGKE
jgi:ketosteroid isomerase-like protein